MNSLLTELRMNDRPAYDLIVSLYNLNCVNMAEFKKLRSLVVDDTVELAKVKEELAKSVTDELGTSMIVAFLFGENTTTTVERLMLLIDVL
jgi:orotate phosphoribosyltransferase-like protein